MDIIQKYKVEQVLKSISKAQQQKIEIEKDIESYLIELLELLKP